MSNPFQELMTGKSDEQLKNYLINSEKYTEEAVTAAVQELRNRGKEFSEEELNEIKQKIEVIRKKEDDEVAKTSTSSWTKNVVTDPEAPALFSQRAIWGFSIIFAVVFGAVLLSSNLKDKGNARWVVLAFGVLYTGLTIFVLSFVKGPSAGFSIGINATGAWIMNQFFWHKYVGQQTKYRAKPIWVPLIISIIITIPFLLAIIYSQPE
jgi:hypothetical protein